MKPLSVGIIGLGGFARSHHRAVLELEKQGALKLACTCDPNPDGFAEIRRSLDFESRNVQVLSNYLEMLDSFGPKLAFVTIPTPVPLHAEMHAACVERGISAYLEKPPTLDYCELAVMLETESRAAKQTNVGFNFIAQETRPQLKERILTNEFGTLQEVRVLGLWPRPESYYQRNNWAGRLELDGRLVLDSCMGNAMAHDVHDALFWCGSKGVLSWASLKAVEAECYRAHAIEGMDTVFVESQTREGPVLRLAMSHACVGEPVRKTWLVCENATLVVEPDGRATIASGKDQGQNIGNGEEFSSMVVSNMQQYAQYVSGERSRPLVRLQDSESFVQLCDLAYIASGSIKTIEDGLLERSATNAEGVEQCFVAISDIGDTATRFLAEGKFPTGQGSPWASGKREQVGIADLPRLQDTVAELMRRG